MISINKKKFLAAFRKVADVPDEDTLVKKLFENVDEGKKEEAEKAFFNTLRIMKAKTAQEVADMPLKDILNCFAYQKIFNDFYEDKKSCEYFDCFQSNIKKQKNYRVCRIL